MHRRQFLKMTGVASATAVAVTVVGISAGTATSAPPVSFGGRLYRSAPEGTIEVSSDGGRTWTRHAHYGDDYTVGALSVRGEQLVAPVRFAGRRFELILSADERHWLLTAA